MNYKTIFTVTVAAVMIAGCARKDETTKVESPIGVTTATVVNQSVVQYQMNGNAVKKLNT